MLEKLIAGVLLVVKLKFSSSRTKDAANIRNCIGSCPLYYAIIFLILFHYNGN